MQGRTIAILETRLGSQLAELLAKHGACPIHAPALAEVPDIDPAFIAAFVNGLHASPPKAVIFQTGVGAQALFQATDGLSLTGKLLEALSKTMVVVRGPKPTAALRKRGVRIDRSAAEPYTSNEVLSAMDDVQLSGERVVVQRYGAVNEKLDQALAQRGALVTEIPTYRWALPADTGPMLELMGALDRRAIDAVVFTSASQAHNLFTLADQHGRKEALRTALNATFVASIGPVCSEALRQHGVGISLEASPPKLGPLVLALNERFS